MKTEKDLLIRIKHLLLTANGLNCDDMEPGRIYEWGFSRWGMLSDLLCNALARIDEQIAYFDSEGHQGLGDEKSYYRLNEEAWERRHGRQPIHEQHTRAIERNIRSMKDAKDSIGE